jgi:hypothetical protein
MDEGRPPGASDEDQREPYVPPAVTWVEPLGHQAALMVSCAKLYRDSQCQAEPTS